MKRDSVMIVGSGMMGCGIAAISALAGEPTILVGTSQQRAEAGAKKAHGYITELLENDLTTKEKADAAYSLISASGNLVESMPKANFVIEAIYEKMQAKQILYEILDTNLPVDVPIASNTSGLRITEIASRTSHPERTMTAHFWFPGHLVPLVEVVMSEYTDENMAIAVKDRFAAWGKAPVLVRQDLPGQLANRVLQAVIREAVNIVEIGLATPEDVDTAIKMGMGIRLPAWGILEHVDGVGVDLCQSVQNTVLPGISAVDSANPLFSEMLSKGELGYKSGKGFYDWSKKDMDALAAGRNNFIIQARKILHSK